MALARACPCRPQHVSEEEKKGGTRATFYIHLLPTLLSSTPLLYPPPHASSGSPDLPRRRPASPPLFSIATGYAIAGNPRPPRGYTVPDDEHDGEVIEENEDHPLLRPGPASEEEKPQARQYRDAPTKTLARRSPASSTPCCSPR